MIVPEAMVRIYNLLYESALHGIQVLIQTDLYEIPLHIVAVKSSPLGFNCREGYPLATTIIS